VNVIQPSEPASVDPLSRVGLYNRIGSGVGIGAQIGETLNGPVTLLDLLRMTDAATARLGTATRAGTYMQGSGKPGSSRQLTQAEAEQRYGVPGFLDFKDHPEGIREAEAKIWHDAAIDRARRAEVLSRASNTTLAQGARLVAGVLATALDPVNIGLALVPGVGEARYGWLAERLGARAARATAGAVDGAIGSAVAEPLTLLDARTEHLDYTAYDSLKNILLGGVLGGGLHLMFGHGPTSTALDSLPQERREEYMRGALDDIEQGRPIDVGQAAYAERKPSGISDAYDWAPAEQIGPTKDPMMAVDPIHTHRVAKKSGGWKALAELAVPKAKVGPVKFIWRHSDDVAASASPRDVLAFAAVVRSQRTLVRGEEGARTWLVKRPGGRIVSYTERAATEGEKAKWVVSIRVIRDDQELEKLFDRPPAPERLDLKDAATGSDGPPAAEFRPETTQQNYEGKTTNSNKADSAAYPGDGVARTIAEDPQTIALHETLARKSAAYADGTDALVSARANQSLTGQAEKVGGKPETSVLNEAPAHAQARLGDHPAAARLEAEEVRAADHGEAQGQGGSSSLPAVPHPESPTPAGDPFPSTKKKKSTTDNSKNRRDWEERNNRPWPRTKFLGRRLEVHHIEARADGGLDHVLNIEPIGRAAHIWHHRMNGDSARFGKRGAEAKRAKNEARARKKGDKNDATASGKGKKKDATAKRKGKKNDASAKRQAKKSDARPRGKGKKNDDGPATR
jgi:hypothetical protein